MTIISRQQATQRWDTIPEKIREALISEPNNQFIWKTCETEHLSPEKLSEILRIAGLVLMGFIHAGDFAQELKESLDLNPQIATSIAKVVNERIFSPLKDDLEKIYEPPSAIAPKAFVLEIKPAAPPPLIKAESPKPLAVSEFDRLNITKPAVPLPPKPFTPSPSGRSSTDFTKAPSAQVELSLPGKPPVIPKPEIRTSVPPPIIIHEEPSVSPLKSAQEFKIDVPQPKLSEIKLNMAPRPAVLEFGASQPPVAKPSDTTRGKPPVPTPARQNFSDGGSLVRPSSPPATINQSQTVRPNSPPVKEEKVRVVHYTELKTPLDGGKNSLPQPPLPPKPPSPPMAPKLPTPPKK